MPQAADRAAAYIRRYQASREKLPRFMKLLGLGDRKPGPSEERYLAEWSGMGFEDEALELSEKAHGFFLLNGHNIHTEFGDIVINNVSSVGSRTGFVVEDAIRRYGFDIRFSYMRTDEMPTEIIEKANPIGITH